MRGVPWSPEAPLALGYVPQGDTRGQRLERKGDVSRRATDPRSLRAAPAPAPENSKRRCRRVGRRLRLGARAAGSVWAPGPPAPSAAESFSQTARPE